MALLMLIGIGMFAMVLAAGLLEHFTDDDDMPGWLERLL